MTVTQKEARLIGVVFELSPSVEADLERPFDFLLDHADTTEDLDRARAVIEALGTTAQNRLAITPFSVRKAAQNPAQRELVIRFGVDHRPQCAHAACASVVPPILFLPAAAGGQLLDQQALAVIPRTPWLLE